MTIRDIILNFVEQYLKKERLYSELCTVTSVDETKRTCEVKPISGATIYGVKIQSIESQTVGIVPVPKVGSYVIVTFLDNRKGFISTYTECTKILIDTDSIIINGGTLDGMVKVNDLVTKLNNLENTLNTFMNTTFNTHTHISAAPGSPTAVPVPVNSGSLTLTVKADLENSKIKQ